MPCADLRPLNLHGLFELDDAQFRQLFRRTPLWRAKRRGLLRNAAIALGNAADPAAAVALLRGLHDAEPLVRGACAWALGRTARAEDGPVLEQRLQAESDPTVRQEIQESLGLLRARP